MCPLLWIRNTRLTSCLRFQLNRGFFYWFIYIYIYFFFFLHAAEGFLASLLVPSRFKIKRNFLYLWNKKKLSFLKLQVSKNIPCPHFIVKIEQWLLFTKICLLWQKGFRVLTLLAVPKWTPIYVSTGQAHYCWNLV